MPLENWENVDAERWIKCEGDSEEVSSPTSESVSTKSDMIQVGKCRFKFAK